jgi:hypothetical protein
MAIPGAGVHHVAMNEEYGLPDRMLGPHPEWFYPALGRVVAICALLETRAQTLAEILARMEQGTLTKKRFRDFVDVAAHAAKLVDTAYQSANFNPVAPGVASFYEKAAEAMERRHAVIHAVWPAQPEEVQFGWRPTDNSGREPDDTWPRGQVRVTQDNTLELFQDLITHAADLVDEAGALISPLSFAVERAREAGYSGTTLREASRAASQSTVA